MDVQLPIDPGWNRRHLLGLQGLKMSELEAIFQLAAKFKELDAAGKKKFSLLNGVVVANLFFEPSTRTKNSFALAARRLGADVIDFSSSGSSLSKGETFIDTAKNIEAMGASFFVVRHKSTGAPELLTHHTHCSVLNAGDGTHEHPTQGLLDIFTIREKLGSLENLTVTLVGDIRHSRVARSNIWGLKTLGARVIVCGPATLIPAQIRTLGVEVVHNLDEAIARSDVINLLRIQFERQRGAFFPSIKEYAKLFGMNAERMKKAKKKMLILAPGPINRGVELTPEVADGEHSVILDQVTNGVLIRMACLALVHRYCEESSTGHLGHGTGVNLESGGVETGRGAVHG
jgi:aspartate carbamoyltransferase catalytic subunit